MQRPTFRRICFHQAQQPTLTRSDEEPRWAHGSPAPGRTTSREQRLQTAPQKSWDGSTNFFGLGHTTRGFLMLLPRFPALLRASRGDKDFPVLLQLFDLGVGALIKPQRLPQMLRMCLGKTTLRGAGGTPNPSFVSQSCSPGVSSNIALPKNQLIIEDALGSQCDTQQQLL